MLYCLSHTISHISKRVHLSSILSRTSSGSVDSACVMNLNCLRAAAACAQAVPQVAKYQVAKYGLAAATLLGDPSEPGEPHAEVSVHNMYAVTVGITGALKLLTTFVKDPLMMIDNACKSFIYNNPVCCTQTNGMINAALSSSICRACPCNSQWE